MRIGFTVIDIDRVPLIRVGFFHERIPRYSRILDTIDSRFDILMANINRNILLQDMERFVSVMNDGGTLILSGFYEADIPLLEDKAKTLGLTLLLTRKEGEWACMVLQ